MQTPAMIYCQHSLGLGHFVRSMTLARAMVGSFDVTFVSGGRPPADAAIPVELRFEILPPIAMTADGTLSAEVDLDEAFAARRARLLALAAETNPELLVVELYPFGRKKFAREIDPLIGAVRARGGKVACSVRDVLVNGKAEQASHDDMAATKLNALFDLVLVHSDERIFNIDESFRPGITLRPPVHHTGYVSQALCAAEPDRGPGDSTLVLAGGGAVGHDLYHLAMQAQPSLWAAKRWPMTLVAGPLFPREDWAELAQRAAAVPGLSLVREAPTMGPLLRMAGRVVSQCGYNSALEIVQAAIPALFVPFARECETEQTTRAERFRALGLCEWAPRENLDAAGLADRLLRLSLKADRASLDMDGAAASARLLEALVA